MYKDESLIKNGLFWLLSRLPFYSLFFVFPVLGMMNCQGWNEGSMESKTCVIDGTIFHVYANFYYGFITFSSFMVFIPLLLYIYACFKASEFFGKKLLGIGSDK